MVFIKGVSTAVQCSAVQHAALPSGFNCQKKKKLCRTVGAALPPTSFPFSIRPLTALGSCWPVHHCLRHFSFIFPRARLRWIVTVWFSVELFLRALHTCRHYRKCCKNDDTNAVFRVRTFGQHCALLVVDHIVNVFSPGFRQPPPPPPPPPPTSSARLWLPSTGTRTNKKKEELRDYSFRISLLLYYNKTRRSFAVVFFLKSCATLKKRRALGGKKRAH